MNVPRKKNVYMTNLYVEIYTILALIIRNKLIVLTCANGQMR